jgi:hypothetical protein
MMTGGGVTRNLDKALLRSLCPAISPFFSPGQLGPWRLAHVGWRRLHFRYLDALVVLGNV